MRRGTTYCPGRAHVRQEWFYDQDGEKYKMGRITNNAHTHAASPGEIRDAQMQLRRLASSQNPPPTRTAVSDVRKNIHEAVRANELTPSSSAMGRQYRRFTQNERLEAGDELLNAPNIDEIVIPARLENLVLFDGHVNNKRLFVFCSNFGRDLLTSDDGNNISIDGTFKV